MTVFHWGSGGVNNLDIVKDRRIMNLSARGTAFVRLIATNSQL